MCMKTSLIIPFKNEVEYVTKTMNTVYTYLSEHQIDFELIAVDDSVDGTWELLQAFKQKYKQVIVVKGGTPPGYGTALQKGFSMATGDIIIPFNGDLSDSLTDVLQYIRLIEEEGYEMVFGSRFMNGAKVTGAKVLKTTISKWGNHFLQTLYQAKCSDITNSFKAYKKTVLEDIAPISPGYNIGMEIALKGILRKYNYTTIPISWTEREYGRSKMSVLKSLPRYLNSAIKIRFGVNN